MPHRLLGQPRHRQSFARGHPAQSYSAAEITSLVGEEGTAMSVAAKKPDHSSGWAIVGSAEGLSAITQPGCGAVVWQRDHMDPVTRWLEAIDPRLLPEGRTTFAPNDADDIVTRAFDGAGTPKFEERDLLINDIISHIHTFTKLMRARRVLMRLERVTGNACKKFHMDRVSARFICTYCGTGTQYGPSFHGEQPYRIFTVPTGSAILVRGTEWKEDLDTLVLHRSPQIAGSGETRFLLVLDQADEVDDS